MSDLRKERYNSIAIADQRAGGFWPLFDWNMRSGVVAVGGCSRVPLCQSETSLRA
ncbi:unnamed protein product [Protopolystoma xenopodis]|uniref:Uncharacterized protein n=1 Tax=Protopolystoma xenopodis TaxID=117903 RepID=A0A3S5FH91_9PLAT|nr:unnamed protein product [Protopolystoma xenopodis]